MLNNFHFQSDIEPDHQRFLIEMTLTDQVVVNFQENGILAWLEMEILNGTHRRIKDGRTFISIQVDQSKYDLMRTHFLQVALAPNQN